MTHLFFCLLASTSWAYTPMGARRNTDLEIDKRLASFERLVDSNLQQLAQELLRRDLTNGGSINGTVSISSSVKLGVAGSIAGVVESPGSLIFNIDSDNNETDRTFSIWTNQSGPIATGARLVTVDEKARLAIIDASPDAALDVVAVSGDQYAVVVSSNNDTPTFLIEHGGNVGVGVVPVNRLTVHKTSNDTISRANAGAYIGDLTLDTGLVIQSKNSSPFGQALQAEDSAGNTAPLLLNPDGGKVGITHVNPPAKLTVHNTWNDTVSRANAAIYVGDLTNDAGLAIQSLATGGNAQVLQAIDSAGNAGRITLNPSGGNVGIGVTNPTVFFHLDKGTGVGQMTLDGSTGGCIMLRDTDDAGWTECDALDGTLSCSIDADGVCD